MKKLLLLFFMLPVMASGMTKTAEKELEKALDGDYQALRNAAFSLKNGYSGYDKNPTAACTLRKIILIVFPNKADETDYSNEYVDCSSLPKEEQAKAWKRVARVIPDMIKGVK